MSEKQPQFTQINEQLSNNIAATVLVERSDGTIDTAHVFDGMGSEGKTTAFLNPVAGDYEAHKIISNEKLSDEHQQELAKQLADVAMDGMVETDDERFDAMFGDDNAHRTPEDAAVRTETEDQRLTRERRWADEKDASMKRIGRSEMN